MKMEDLDTRLRKAEMDLAALAVQVQALVKALSGNGRRGIAERLIRLEILAALLGVVVLGGLPIAKLLGL